MVHDSNINIVRNIQYMNNTEINVTDKTTMKHVYVLGITQQEMNASRFCKLC